MPDTFAHYVVQDRWTDLPPAEHIDRARAKIWRAIDCGRIGHLYFDLISEAADHLRSAGLDELADRCDAIVADGFGGGGELHAIDEALAAMAAPIEKAKP